MVSPQRRWDKILNMESKIMAYHVMISSDQIPLTNDVIRLFDKSRLGEKPLTMEVARAHQAQFDLKQDIIKNLEGMELTWKDYIPRHMAKDDKGKMVLTELGSILEGIEEPSRPKPKKKKEVAKDA